MPCPGFRTGPRCKSPCGHYAIVSDYREERMRQALIADDMHAGERAEHLARNPLVTFRDWLIGHKRTR